MSAKWSELYGWGRPETIPQQMPDRAETKPETVLVQRDGKSPLIQRVPRPLGFRPERAK